MAKQRMDYICQECGGAIVDIVKAIILDAKKLISCCVYLDGKDDY